MDVFDAADLLAIEADSLSSSSSCSVYDANGSDETSSKPLHEDKEEPSSRPQHESKLDDGNRLQARTTITKSLLVETAEDSDNDDSSEDDGFLESMLTFQKRSTPTQDDNLQQQTIEEKYVDSDSGTKVSSNQPLNESIDAHKSFDANADDAPILLGDSISKWMTSHQALKEKPTTKQRHDGKERPTWKTYDGAISVQNVEGNDGIHISSTLRLSVGKKRKRQTVAGSEVAEATLEQLQSPGDTQNDEKQQYCGIAAIAPDAERSNVGTMVDCLARYDPEKGAYVLEIVDLDVSGLTTTQLEDDGRDKDVESSESNELPAERAHSIIADPRSRAKQAAKQVERLKQGRGKRSERKRPTSAPNTNNTESKK